MPKKISEDIALIPTYSEDGSIVTLIIDKLDGLALTTNDLIAILQSYTGMLKASKGSKEGLN